MIKKENADEILCYISGPMTGFFDFNFPAFFSMENMIIKICGVVNPARIAQKVDRTKKNPTYGDYLKADITELMDCDCVFFLEGYESSRGATLEKRIAEAMSIPCFHRLLDLKKFVEEKKNDKNQDEDF